MDFDIAILGAGPAGYVAAIRAAQLGTKTCVIEKGPIGGVCLNWGCIPTKTLVETAALLEKIRRAQEYAISVGEIHYDFTRLQQRKNSVVGKMRDGILQLFKNYKIEVVEGRGTLTGGKSISVSKNGSVSEIKASKIIVASGSEPKILKPVPFNGTNVLSSTDILELNKVPESLLVIGGGVIGCEFASIFHALGSKVTIVEMMDQLLPNEDMRLARTLQTAFKKKGIDVFLKQTAKEVSIKDRRIVAVLENGTVINAEKALVSVGRSLNSEGIGIEAAGIKAEKGAITTNEYLETNIPGVYAAGDITGVSLLAHTAHHQGIYAAENAHGMKHPIKYDVIPACIYTMPEAGSVGLNEKSANDKGIKTVVGRFSFAANSKATIAGETEGFAQIVADAANGRILGAQVIGLDATNLLSEIAVLMTKSAGIEDIAHTIHPHPTLSEVWMEAALDAMGRAIHIISRKK